MGLGLSRPWFVSAASIEEGELHIHIDFERGSGFEGKSIHDSVERTWRHLNFWQYPTYLHAKVPRVVGEDGKVTQVDVPWARPGSGFTALFEALAITMARSMPVSAVGKLLAENDMRIWRLLEKAVESAREQLDFSHVRRIGVDETACQRGQNYITTFVDLERSQVLFGCQGKGADTLLRFKKEFESHKGKVANVVTFSCDMSAAFLSGIAEFFPKAKVVLDKFHLVKMVSDAVDITRRADTKQSRNTKGTRFLWLKNPSRLSGGETAKLQELRNQEAFSDTSEAYRLRLAFQELFEQPKPRAAKYLANWLDAALECGVKAIEDVAETFFKIRDKILSWFDSRVSNGLLEGLNSVLQSAKARARGYGNPQHMILMSYLLHGRLNLDPQAVKAITRKRQMSTKLAHAK